MPYEIIFAPEAVEDLRSLRADVRPKVKASIETFLKYEPTKISKSRIKRLREMFKPQYRLRVDDIRVFYDVIEDTVEILAIVPKSEAEAWLAEQGELDEGNSSSRNSE